MYGEIHDKLEGLQRMLGPLMEDLTEDGLTQSEIALVHDEIDAIIRNVEDLHDNASQLWAYIITVAQARDEAAVAE